MNFLNIFKRRLVYRLWLIFGLVYLTSVLGLLFFVFQSQKMSTIDTFRIESENRLEIAQKEFSSSLRAVERDIALLAESPAVINFLLEEESYGKEDLISLFKQYLKTRDEYFQIRLIRESDGMELVRLEKKDSLILSVAEDSLQEKSTRDYYIEARSLENGELYLSDINLNRERGELSIPYTSTLRAASLLKRDEFSKKVIIVINIDVGQWLKKIAQIAGERDDIFVFKAEGEYIYHKDESKSFAADKNGTTSFTTEVECGSFALLSEAAGRSCTMNGEKVFLSTNSLSYSGQFKRQIWFANVVKEGVLLGTLEAERKSTLWLGVLLLVIGLNILFILSRRLAKPIRVITDHIDDWKTGEHIQLEEEKRQDEIGTLARSFAELGERLRIQISTIEKSRRAAEKASEEREQFVANLSHELRTPLNSILGMVTVLANNEPLPKQKAVIQTLEFSAKNLRAMIEDVLDFSRIEAGTIHVKNEPVILEELIRNVILSHKARADSQGLRLDYEIAQVVPERIQSDGLRLFQILNNLISNAVKFTKEGFVHLEVTSEGEELLFVVKDSGSGISAEDQEKIFNRFSQSDLARTEGKGLGLGLSIVKNLVSILNGEMDLLSEEGKGSAFTVKLPYEEYIEQEVDSVQSPSGEAIRILYVDDIEINRFTLESLLEGENIELHMASSCAEATKFCEQNEVDAIVLDLKMPEVDGFQCIPLLRQKSSAPIIALSANLGDLERSKLSGMEVQYQLEKPLSKDELMKTLGQAIVTKSVELIESMASYFNTTDPEKIKKGMTLLMNEVDRALKDLKMTTDEDVKLLEDIKHRLKPSLIQFGRSEILDLPWIEFMEALKVYLGELRESLKAD